MRTRISITTASLAILLATASPAHASDQVDCVLNLDTGTFTCGPATPTPMASSYVLATLYTNANYGGSSLALQAATPCDTNADVDHSWATLPAGFADEVSSVKGANNCQIKLFEHTNHGGTSLGPLTSTTYVGDTINDKASSIQLS
jgi:hypothetical protein